jgi:hypothetical protein
MLSLLGAGHSTSFVVRILSTQFVIFMLWGMLHIAIHEAGHVLAALMVGCKIKQIGISRLGPYVRRTSAKTPLGNTFVALSGPGINLLTAALFLVFDLPYPWIPLFIGLLNLVPLPNSDMSKGIEYLRNPAHSAAESHPASIEH